MLELWPQEMDSVQHHLAGKHCTAAAALRQLAEAGYALFELAVKSRHWSETELPLTGERFARPLNFDALCEWYRQRGEKHKQPTEMGYWTDVLAVAPGESFEFQFAAVLHKEQTLMSQTRTSDINGLPKVSMMARTKYKLALSMEDGH